MPKSNPPQLARRIGLPLISFYGLGTILGAGIYVLVGKVAGAAGMLSPLAFLVAAVIAGVTALSYARLVSAFPQSAGESVYIHKAFGFTWLSTLIGWFVVMVGVVSSATIVVGFAGYSTVFVSLPEELVIFALVLLLASVASWGIAESLWIAAVMTLIEIFGLLLVLFLTRQVWLDTHLHFADFYLPAGLFEITGVLSGSILAFYAFIGFEDMVNVVEEVKEPEKNMPRAILIALVVSTLLYMLIAIVAVSVVPVEVLQASKSPMSDIVKDTAPWAGNTIALISLFAVLNGALIQTIMGSRVLYGMANVKMAPEMFSRVNSRTKTPVIATTVLAMGILFLALMVPLLWLAKITSFVVLSVFTLVNLSLWRLQKTGGKNLLSKAEVIDKGAVIMPAFPVVGVILCSGLLFFQIYHELSFLFP